MIFRDINNIMIDLNRYSYKNDKEYYNILYHLFKKKYYPNK